MADSADQAFAVVGTRGRFFALTGLFVANGRTPAQLALLIDLASEGGFTQTGDSTAFEPLASALFIGACSLTTTGVTRFSWRTWTTVSASKDTASDIAVAALGVEVAPNIIDAFSLGCATTIIAPATECLACEIIVTIRGGYAGT